MIVALIDNGSLEPAAHRNLRAVAAALSRQAGIMVHAVSWKHSDRIPSETLGDTPAWTLIPFVRAMYALGQREFVFVPFFISAQGAIGSALRFDVEKLKAELAGMELTFTDGLAAREILATIAADRVREQIAAHMLVRPNVVLVDHGGPSPISAALRDRLATGVRLDLGNEIDLLAAASMEGSHPPLLSDQLRASDFAGRDIVVGLLFLSPGRHAGAGGDVERICAASGARCHLTELVGTHPLATKTLAAALRETLSVVHDPILLPSGCASNA
jgi:sirohydrochlorin ferrochelatase